MDSHERTVYTFTPVILLEADDRTRRGIVAKKDDREVTADDVPILTDYAGDGYGEKQPLHLPEEGYLMSLMYPKQDFLKETGFVDEPRKQRSHEFEDGGFIKRSWLDDMQVPVESNLEDYLYFHKSETFIKIREDGEFWFEHFNGWRLHGDENGIEMENDDSTHRARVDDNGVHMRVLPPGSQEEGDPERVRIDLTEDEITIDAKQATVHDTDAEMVDGPEVDPVTGARNGTKTRPIEDPLAAPGYNPSIVQADGPLDFNFFEARGMVLERFEEDPDPPFPWMDEPLGILNQVPIGYLYFNLSTDTPMVMTAAGPQPLI